MNYDAVTLQQNGRRGGGYGQFDETSALAARLGLQAFAPGKEAVVAHGVVSAPGGDGQPATLPSGDFIAPFGGWR